MPGPWRTYVPKEQIRLAVKVLRAVRDAVGPDVDLLLDIHRRLAPMHAIDLADALAEFEPYWLEEPCQCDNIEALAEVRHRSKIPVVTGEALYTRADFRPIFRARAADIINPDVSNCGGILELMHIADAAEAETIAVSPHNYNSTTLALSATVHASACMPNFIITEYFLPFEEIGAKLCPNLLKPVNGYIALPEGPGLGLDVNEAEVRADKRQTIPGADIPRAAGRRALRHRRVSRELRRASRRQQKIRRASDETPHFDCRQSGSRSCYFRTCRFTRRTPSGGTIRRTLSSCCAGAAPARRSMS